MSKITYFNIFKKRFRVQKGTGSMFNKILGEQIIRVHKTDRLLNRVD
jgi:hypothetical protein